MYTSSTMTKIGIDCRLAGKAHAGIGRYIENLILRLPIQAPDLQFVFFFHDQPQADAISNLSQLPNVSTILAPIQHYSLAEQWQLPAIFNRHKLDLLHVPHFNVPFGYTRPYVVTIHDLLWHEQKGTTVTTLPSWQYWLKYWGYRFITGNTIRHAQKIFVPANTIRQTLLKYYPSSQSKIEVTYEGVDASLTKTDHPIKVKATTSPQFLLYVGSLYPHKNIDVILRALMQLPDFELNIVGARNVFVDQVKQQVQQLGLSQRVHFLGFVADRQLNQLYQEAVALIQPSLSEGFGLTGVEAMALQTPVIASNIPIFHEIYQSAALFFDPQNANSLAHLIQELTPTARQKLITSGLDVIQHYSWEKMVGQTIDAYRQVIT